MTEPGVYTMAEDAYHANDALSSSGARRLLPPGCPALFKWERDHGRPNKRTFDLGHAAHKEVLGVGMDIVPVDADDWRTKAAQQARKDAYAEGKVPLLVAEVEQVKGMALALLEHPYASVLFDPDRGGAAEQSIFWHDAQHGVDRRARLDWLPTSDGGRLIIPDYKSTVSAEPGAVAKSIYNFGYYIQEVYYSDAVRALGLADDLAFVFVMQERTPPYLVTVAECDSDAKLLGRAKVDQACEVFSDCTANDTWPGYSSDVELISLPRWAA